MCSTTYRKRFLEARADYRSARHRNVPRRTTLLGLAIGFVILVATITTPSTGEEPDRAGEKFRSDAEREALCHFESKGRIVRNGRLFLNYGNDDELTAEDWRQLSHLESLTELYLIGKKFTDEHLMHLKDLRSLQRLNLVSASVTGEGLRHLKDLPSFDSLASNRPLTHLRELKNLKRLRLGSGRTVTDDHVVQVAELDKLEQLSLARTGITDNALKHVAKLRKLKRLDLSGTRITDNALKHVAKLHKLKRLNLSGTRITDEGLVHLRSLRHLEVLDLLWTRISDNALVRHLRHIKSLRRLIHPDSYVTHQRTKELREELELPNVFIPFDIPP